MAIRNVSRRWRWWSAAPLGAVAVCGGCSADPPAWGGGELQQQTSPLASWNDGNFRSWEDNNDVVPICYVEDQWGLDTRWSIREALEATWHEASGLDFRFNGMCPSPTPPGHLTIYLKQSTDPNKFGGKATPGFKARLGSDPRWGGRTDVQAYIVENTDTNRLLRSAVHEIGHALGVMHEHQRADRDPLCPKVQQRFDDDPNDPNLVIVSDGELLTEHDSLSIMSYCARDHGRRNHLLTSLDALGVEIMHPVSFQQGIGCAEGCFQGADGLIARTDGGIVPEWRARGAHTDAFVATRWVSDGSVVGFGLQLPVSSLPADSVSSVSISFEDYRDRWHRGSGNVTTSDAQHAAVVLSVL